MERPKIEGWYAGDPHIHTTWSDGRLPISEVAARAKDNRLDWIIITDHSYNWLKVGKLRRLCRRGIHQNNVKDYLAEIRTINETKENQTLQVIGGIELGNTIPLRSRGHYLVYPIPAKNKLAEKCCTIPAGRKTGHPRTAINLINEAESLKGFGYVAHPQAWPFHWQGEYFYHTLQGMEVLCGGKYYHKGNDFLDLGGWAYETWMEKIRGGFRVAGFAGTDIHYGKDHVQETGELVTYVKAKTGSPENILEGLKLGRSCFGLGAWMDIKLKWNDEEKEIGETVRLPLKEQNITITTRGENYNNSSVLPAVQS